MGKTRKEKKRLVILSFITVFLLVALFFSVYPKFMQIIKNNNDIEEKKLEYEESLKQNDILSAKVNKMQDPDYMERYAKEKYLYSSPDEVIIRMD